MSNQQYILDHLRLLRYKDKTESPDEQVAELLGISRAQLSRIINHHPAPVSQGTLDKILESARKKKKGLTQDELSPLLWLSAKWGVTPLLSKGMQLRLQEAVAEDMEAVDGAETAVETASQLIHETKAEAGTAGLYSLEFQSYVFLWDRYLTFLDHCGRAEEALDELGNQQRFSELFERSIWKELPALNWLYYQRGICLAQIGQVENAQECFAELQESQFPDVVTAATYQQLRLQVESLNPDLAKFQADADRIETKLEKLISEWEGTHREGYIHQSLAELARKAGERNTALDQYLQAHAIFAEHKCKRYVLQVREDIRNLMP